MRGPFAYPGALFGVNLASGEQALCFPDHVGTHLGPVTNPNGDYLMFPRITTVGGFRIVGGAHTGMDAWLYAGGQWMPQGPRNGSWPAIFDRNGALLIVRPAPNVTSQGYRYIDEQNRPVMGDDTYYSPALGLSEYTTLAGVSIGQGHDRGGVRVVIDGIGRLLDSGPCTMVQVDHAGGQFAISYTRVDRVIQLWISRDELAALPKDEAPPVAETPGCHDGFLTDPRAYFFSLVAGTVATDWPIVLPRIQPDLNKMAILLQHDSSGAIRPRLFLQNPTGTFARNIDITDNPPQTSPDGGWRWTDWNPSAGYIAPPCSGVVIPPDPPPSGDWEARFHALESRVNTLETTAAKKGDPVTVTLPGKIG
jgi:hypothetical protein